MNIPTERVEELALDELEPQLLREGYRLVRRPHRADLPFFFQGYTPDAVAYGNKKNIAIEIKSGKRQADAELATQLRKLFEDHDDWELQFIYFTSDRPDIRAVSPAELTRRSGQIRSMVEHDVQAAFLLAWAVLEAAVRSAGLSSARPRSARGLVSVLAAAGMVDHDEVPRLFALADLRNEIAHGELGRLPESIDVSLLLDIAGRLLSDSDARGAG